MSWVWRHTPDEGYDHQVSVLLSALGPLGTAHTRMVDSDAPSTLDVAGLYEVFTALECVSADPLQIALRVEKASNEHLTDMTVCLRRPLAKLKLGVADGLPYFRAGGRTPPHPTLARCMIALTQRGARRKVRKLGKGSTNIATPYIHIDGLAIAMAEALVRRARCSAHEGELSENEDDCSWPRWVQA